MYLIRADGNAKIGAGHLMRCLTIAEELGELLGGREEICFLCADGQSGELASDHGFRVCVLESDYTRPETELSAWEKIPGINKETNVILMDSYFVTEDYLKAVQSYGHVTLLDDMGKHRFPVDRIVNYNAFADRTCYERLYAGTTVELVLGSAYVPVRPQFLRTDYHIRERAENVLITTGGGDAENIAGRILKTIDDEKLNYHLIIGAFNPHYEEMKALESSCSNVRIYHKVEDMAGLMQSCDLAITAGGTTIYELSAVGVPLICFSYAENQEALTEYMGREEIAPFAGAFHRSPRETLDRMALEVRELCQNQDKRNECYKKEKAMIDGMGARRLARMLAETMKRREVFEG